MRIQDATFLKGAASAQGWPDALHPEVALVGRSNVGKSSLLNHLLGRKSMARVSGTPGRTRLINFFQVQGLYKDQSEPRCLIMADLPGFGFAKVSKAERSQWRGFVEQYLGGRTVLTAVLLLFDARRVVDSGQDPAIMEEEVALCQWLRDQGRRIVPVMTKADKLSKHERKPALMLLRQRIGIPPVAFSALSGEGTEELWQKLLQP